MTPCCITIEIKGLEYVVLQLVIVESEVTQTLST